MPSPHRVEELLTAEELGELRAFLREKRRTTDQVWEWLQARGYTLARSSAGNWLAKERGEEAAERMRASSSVAMSLMEAAKESGGVGIQDAAVLQIGHAIIEKLSDMQGSGEVTTNDLSTLALSMQRLTLSKRQIEKVRADIRDEMKAEQEAALAQAEKTVKAGGSGGDVINTVRSLLGIATGSASTPASGQPPAPAGGAK